MRRSVDICSVAILMVMAVVLFVYAQSPKTDPCQKRLDRIAKEVTALWLDPMKGKEMRRQCNLEAMERWLRRQIKEPLSCPVLRLPYRFFPEELSKRWQVPVLLADPKPHPDGHLFAVIPLPDPTKNELGKFIATSLPPSREIQRLISQARQQALSDLCISNLRNVGSALAMYVQDYDGRFPPMRVAAETQKVLYPYLRNRDVFFCPATRKPYQPNLNLHLKRLQEISHPSEMPTFYDPQPHPDGTRGVAFADGHVKAISKSEWLSLQKRHRLPMNGK
jgi:prepilin-type processing-associated H-X9-DG protein